MSEDRNKILEKAKKLKELALRGVDGEMDNAKVMLENYMKKHNISEEELDGFNKTYSSSGFTASYQNMTDDEFFKEIIKEFIPVGLGAMFARYGSDDVKHKQREQVSIFVNKVLSEMLRRVENINNKKKSK